MQVDMGIENALTTADCEMALHYLLNQCEPLDAFLVGLIYYFELQTLGASPDPKTLGNFFPVITLVEQWMKLTD